MTPDTLLSIRGLTKSFRTGAVEVNVLRGIDMDVARGEMLSVVGSSGVGKSTLLHIMGALDRPTSGTVLYEGRDIFGMDDAELALFRNRSVGFVFQFHHLLPEFTALENALIPAKINGMGLPESLRRARSLFEEVGISGRESHRPGELSGGEQQRVAIARALMLDPAVVLADEPTGNLDTHTAGSVHELLVRLNREKGTTFVIVTHNERLAGITDRTVRMLDGRFVEEAAA